jgi:hypothetical protein
VAVVQYTYTHKEYRERHKTNNTNNTKIRKSAGRAPSLRVLPWHLSYNGGKSTEKPQSETNKHFFIISRSFLLRMRNVSDKSYRENQNTLSVIRNIFFFENHAVYGITWKYIVERGRPQITI